VAPTRRTFSPPPLLTGPDVAKSYVVGLLHSLEGHHWRYRFRL